MKKSILVLSACISLMGSVVFAAAPTYWTDCTQPGFDHGYQAIFANNDEGKLVASLSAQSINGPHTLAVLPCAVVGRKHTPSGDMYTTTNCQDGNDAGYRVTLTSGGFAGLIHAVVYKNVTQVAQLTCSVKSAR